MKHSKFIVFLSALLCVATLFASCGEEPETPDTDNNGEGGAVQNETLDQAALLDFIDKVNKYVGYEGKENGSAANEFYSLADGKIAETLLDYDFKYVGVVLTRKVSLVENSYDIDLVFDGYKAINLLTGKPIYTSALADDQKGYKPGATPDVTYGFEVYGDAILEVAVNRAEANGTDKTYKTIYQYYTLDGIQIAAIDPTKDDRAYVSDYDDETGDMTLVIKSRSYIIRDGEVIYEFDVGAERPLPLIEYEYATYKYVYKKDRDAQYIQVLNSDFVCIFEYKLPFELYDYGFATSELLKTKLFLLGNGSLFIKGMYMVEDDDTDYDYENYMAKYKTYNAIVTLDTVNGTASATELDLPFIVEEIFTTQTPDLDFKLLSPDYNFATVSEFDKENFLVKTYTVALNNDMAKLEVIPEVILTQNKNASNIRFVKENVFVFDTTVKNYPFTYIVNSATHTMTLISNDSVYMDDYFYTEDAVYDYSLNNLYTFTGGERVVCEIGNGLVITDGENYRIFSLNPYVGAHTTEIVSSTLGESYVGSYGDFVVVHGFDSYSETMLYRVYNCMGEIIADSDTLPSVKQIAEDIYLVSYTVTVKDSISGITESYKKTIAVSSK